MSMSMQAAPGKRSGWVMFAAILMFAVGGLRVISGISYLGSSHKVNDLTGGLFGHSLWVWGLWDLGIAALAIYAGYSLLGNGAFGRIAAYVWAFFVIIQGFLYIGLAPWYGAAAITLAVLVVYGLTVAEPER